MGVSKSLKDKSAQLSRVNFGVKRAGIYTYSRLKGLQSGATPILRYSCIHAHCYILHGNTYIFLVCTFLYQDDYPENYQHSEHFSEARSHQTSTSTSKHPVAEFRPAKSAAMVPVAYAYSIIVIVVATTHLDVILEACQSTSFKTVMV